MSDEIVDVSALEVDHIPEEIPKAGKDGLVIPDPEVVDSPTGETIARLSKQEQILLIFLSILKSGKKECIR